MEGRPSGSGGRTPAPSEGALLGVDGGWKKQIELAEHGTVDGDGRSGAE